MTSIFSILLPRSLSALSKDDPILSKSILFDSRSLPAASKDAPILSKSILFD
jgi:hypothetical protein